MAKPLVFSSGVGVGSQSADFSFTGGGSLSSSNRIFSPDRGAGRPENIDIRPSTVEVAPLREVYALKLADRHVVSSGEGMSLCVGCATCAQAAQAASAGKGFNGYEVAAVPHTADGGSTTHDEGVVAVAVGGSASGTIDFTGDTDTLTVSVVAGQTYSVYVYGSGPDAVTDTFLQVLTPGAVLVNQDDDGGIGLYSMITFTAATTGDYQIVVSSFNNPGDPGLGDYTVTVHQQGADEAPSAPPSVVEATLGLNYGFISPAGTDEDVYSITLTAGTLYNFEVAAGADYNTNYQAVPLGEVDTIIRIYDSAGTLLYTNDDIDFQNGDISSALSFIPDTTGTYYVEVDGYTGQTGGYALEITETDLGDIDILDSIDWGGLTNVVDNSDTLLIYFAADGEVFDGVTSMGWTAYEQGQALAAFQTYSQFTNLTFAITTNQAEADFTLVTTESDEFLGYFNPPGETNAGVGVFAVNGTGWDSDGSNGGLEPGGYGWITFIHEFGHGLGMAHPHDTGGGSDVLLGVTGPFDSYGVFDLNQGIYTTMSYNDGWQLHPDAVSGFPPGGPTQWGYQGTPMALDIALMQLKYGTVDHNTGDNVYILPTANEAGTYWQCIWDTGGNDTIVQNGTVSAQIDLTAATLDYTATGGGVISWVDGVFGGYTIANGVVIENATGGSGADTLLGNQVANVLSGNDGADTLMGREGDDTLYGGEAIDTAVFSGNQADYTITFVSGTTFTVTDNNAADGDDGTDTLYDMEFAQFADGIVALSDQPPGPNTAPTLTGVPTSFSFDENVVNATPQFLMASADFEDAEGNFNGGTVVVSGLVAGDVVAVNNQGTGAGQIGVSGSNITYGGTVIGSFAGGTGATLTITLNGFATSAAVEELLQNLTFANTSNTPTADRTLTVNVTDSDGADLSGTVFVPGPFTEVTGGSDPLGGLPAFGAGPVVTAVDVNGDGDIDLVVGDQPGTLRYFENNGSGYTEITGGSNPFAAINSTTNGTYSAPDAVDVDGDGDLDIVWGFAGTNGGQLGVMQNNGNGTWTNLVGAGVNPFNGVDVGNFSDPAGGDYDGDGDIDVIVSNADGNIFVFQNNGSGVFTQLAGAANPFNGVDVGSFASLAAGDIDGDGDLDVVAGNGNGTLVTFLNDGSGVFTNTPPSGIFATDFGAYSLPTLADIDGDGDADLIVGDNASGDTRVFINTSTTTTSTPPEIDVHITAQNDAPTGTDGSASIDVDTSYTFDATDFGFGDLDGNGFAGVVITTLPANGTLYLNGVAITTPGTFVSAADIAADLLVFEPDAGETGNGYGNFTFQVRDDGGTANGGSDTDPVANTFVLNVQPDNTAPTLTGVVAEVTYGENTVNATPQLLDTNVTFDDAEGNFDGGTVVVSGLLAEDVVGINNQGTAAGQIGVSGSNVTYGGVTIGTIAGGSGTTLTVTLNAAATSAAVDALLQNLTYANTSDTPTGTRTLTINVTDDQGLDLVTAGTPGGFVEATGGDDPLTGLPAFLAGPSLAFVDVNNDGDLDIVVGDEDGSLRYFENNGAGYTEVTGEANPFGAFVGETFGGATPSGYTAPAVADIDGDGDLDLVVGNNYGYFATIQNNGDGSWTQLLGAANPLDGIIDIYFSDPAALDVDGDGDIDIVAGSSFGDLYTLLNNGDGSFTVLGSVDGPNPFFSIDVGNFSSPAAGDVNGDGLDDLIVGNSAGIIRTFINNGDGSFTEATGTDNPFNGIDVGSYAIPTLADVDGDGDADLVVGDNVGGDTRVWINTSTPGTSAPQIVVNVTAQNDAPVLADVSALTVYTHDAQPIVLSGSLDISDPDDTNMEGAAVTITNVQTGDQLLINGTTSGTVGSISYSYSAGVLTLTGSATLAEYEAALQLVAFNSTATVPSTVDRDITWTVSDGSDTSAAGQTTLEFASAAPTNTFTLGDDATIILGGGEGQIYATSGEQTVTILDDSYFIFRSGFNSGAQDTINLSGVAENFEASVLSVSNVLLHSVTDNITIILSIGENGTIINFEGGDSRVLTIDGDTGVVTLDGEVIDESPDYLSPDAPPPPLLDPSTALAPVETGFHGMMGDVRPADYSEAMMDFRPHTDIHLTADIFG